MCGCHGVPEGGDDLPGRAVVVLMALAALALVAGAIFTWGA